MNVVDSSAWLEYFAAEPNAELFAPAVEEVSRLVVPTIVLYEVFKRVLQQADEAAALQAAASMAQAKQVDLTPRLALQAAGLSARLNLPMADSIILTTARSHGATLWTQDSDFEGLEGVRYFPKR
ncbi:MAG TPA: type II toxin-antitoxin system VapC family toxin [Thermoanaerobaculia bacterium]